MTKMAVNKTADLSVFKKMKGNRVINPQHVLRLEKSIYKYGMLINPILVNEKNEVIDGQHRLEAAKKAKSEIYYIVADSYGIDQIHALNLNQKNWTKKQFLDGYAEMGIQPYITFLKFVERNDDLSFSALQMLADNNAGQTSYVKESEGSGKVVFNDGTWSHKNMSTAQKWADMIREVKPYYSGYNRTAFVGAMITLFKHEDFDHKQFISKLANPPKPLTDCAKRQQYRDLIEEIYNYRRRTKVNLRLM